jgi:hypothetical protein
MFTDITKAHRGALGGLQGLKTMIASAMVRSSRKAAMPVEELERLHLSPETPNFNDSSYFFGADGAGTALAVRLAFRTGKPDEAWLDLRLPGRGPYQLGGDAQDRGTGFSLGPLSFTCESTGQRWRIRYDGLVTIPEGELPLELDLTFEARTPVVDFANHANNWAVAEAIAAETWSKEFFERLREIHKVHYEQGGRLLGRATIDGQEVHLDLPSIRDHSFGTRRWGQWDRHIWILGALEDGSFFNVSMIRYDFLGSLRTGWRWRQGIVQSVVDCDDFAHFVPARKPPSRFTLTFRTRHGSTETALIEAKDAFDFDLDHGAYLIREWITTMKVGGVRGVGVAEFGWNPRIYG